MNADGASIRVGLKCLSALAAGQAERTVLLEPIVEAMRQCVRNEGTLFFCGNGGSAADAQHIAAEYVVRYKRSGQKPMRAIALTTDSSVLTACGNDLRFEAIFSRQIMALARAGDVLVVHSTSGDSKNCLAAVQSARPLGVTTIALLGNEGGALAKLVDHAFIVRDGRANHVQEIHLAIQHQIAEILTGEA